MLPERSRPRSGWTPGNGCAELADLLERIQAELAADVDAFEERRLQAIADRKGYLVDRYEKTINTLTKRNLISFLANRNVLPKYGFPTDTVELRTQYADSRVGGKLDLSRDLSSAIYEFAPGAELVAGGLLWTSGGVYRLPDRELISKYYTVCRACGGYRESDEPLDPICPSCDAQHTGTPRRYCVPEFGFVAQRSAKRPGMSPPQAKLERHDLCPVTGRRSRAGHLAAGQRRHGDHPGWLPWPAHRGLRGAGPGGVPDLRLVRVGDAGGQEGPDKHPHLLRDRDVPARLQHRSLAHRYETDIARDLLRRAGRAAWRTTATGDPRCTRCSKACRNGCRSAGTTSTARCIPTPGGRTSLVIFDAVPGGAGSAIRIARSFDEVVRAALDRVERCDCGEETSCYGCLRGYRNQPFHEQLRRGAAVDFLRPLVPADACRVTLPVGDRTLRRQR